MNPIPHFIAGNTYLESNAPSQKVHNPASGAVSGEVFFATEVVCDRAVAAAQAAGPAWQALPLPKKAKILFKFRELLEKYQDELAAIVTHEHGKTLEDAKGSIFRGIEVVEFYSALVTQLHGDFTPNVATNMDCYTILQPLGICAGVSPFNFPVMVPLWMMIPAIACGNTFILKPSEQDPSAPLKLLELLTEAGLPPGVVNIVNGDKHTVDILLKHPDIAAFTAVASTPVAEHIYSEAIANGKRAHTFGGAKNHCVVMPDADLDSAVEAIVGAAYGSAGERCMAISVVVAVGEPVANQLVGKLVPRTQAIKVDVGTVPSCDMGPVISEAHLQRVRSAISAGVAEGAQLILDGRGFVHANYPQGYFIGPTLFDFVTEQMSIYQQEIFGPVLIVVRVDNFEDALSLVNRNQYGNGTAIFTRDGGIAHEYTQRVRVGMVGVNVPIPVPIASHPFGGWKRSMFGDSKMHGRESINFYTQRKTITTRWVANVGGREFVMPSH